MEKPKRTAQRATATIEACGTVLTVEGEDGGQFLATLVEAIRVTWMDELRGATGNWSKVETKVRVMGEPEKEA